MAPAQHSYPSATVGLSQACRQGQGAHGQGEADRLASWKMPRSRSVPLRAHLRATALLAALLPVGWRAFAAEVLDARRRALAPAPQIRAAYATGLDVENKPIRRRRGGRDFAHLKCARPS